MLEYSFSGEMERGTAIGVLVTVFVLIVMLAARALGLRLAQSERKSRPPRRRWDFRDRCRPRQPGQPGPHSKPGCPRWQLWVADCLQGRAAEDGGGPSTLPHARNLERPAWRGQNDDRTRACHGTLSRLRADRFDRTGVADKKD